LRARPPLPPPTRALPPATPTAGPPATLLAARYVYVRRGGQVQPLAPLYAGPYLVVEAGPKTFKVQVGDNVETLSVDRLKPHTGGDPKQPAVPPWRGRPQKAAVPAASVTTRTWAEVVKGLGTGLT